MLPVSAWTHIGALVAGIASCWWVMDSIATKKEQEQVIAQQREQIKQEKRNVQVVEQYAEGLAAVTRHFRDVPVRVQFPRGTGQPGTTGCPEVSPEDVVFSGGSPVAGNRTTDH